jgi:hypothetical protein
VRVRPPTILDDSLTLGRPSPVRRAACAAAAALLAMLLVPVPAVGQGGPDPIPVPAGAAVTRPEQFVGVWAYNAEDSRNIATGRPERGPRGGAAARPLVPRAPVPARGADSGDQRAPVFGPSPEMLRENRDLSRDLLEIAETLTFAVADGSVTITDDLGRALTYPTDNERERYRLGASAFQARVRWEDGRLRRDIEGTFGFRLSETYFLSPDAERLFVIIRVGAAARGRPQAGVDRVYDRTRPEEQ